MGERTLNFWECMNLTFKISNSTFCVNVKYLFVCNSGYPDSTYLTCLCEALVAHGIEGVPAISQDQAKSWPGE